VLIPMLSGRHAVCDGPGDFGKSFYSEFLQLSS